MGPLRLMLKKELYRRWATEALVGQHGMVSPQPVGQVPVQGSEVVKEQVLMVIHELFLDSAIELFGMGVTFPPFQVQGEREETAALSSCATSMFLEANVEVIVAEVSRGADSIPKSSQAAR